MKDIKKNSNINFFTVEEIADILKIGKTKAYQLMRTDGFPAIKLQRTYRVSEQDFMKWANDYKGKEYLVS